MKKYLFILGMISCCLFQVNGQSQKINYQGVATDANGLPKISSFIRIQFSLLDSIPTGSVLYTENHHVKTDSSGYFTCQIGGGTSVLGQFDQIDWTFGKNKYLKTSLDLQGGYNFVSVSTAPFLSVPFAFSSNSSISAQSSLWSKELKDSLGNTFQVKKEGNQVQLVQTSTVNTYKPVFRACGDTVWYEGQLYPTVSLDTGCWFKTNLNVGKQVVGAKAQTNNQIFEKYCLNDLPAYCDEFGGLYQWAEAMNYTYNASNSGTLLVNVQMQGICPTGWHIPNFQEYCGIAQFLDPSYDCNIPFANNTAGASLMANYYWELYYNGSATYTGGNNSSGFSILPSGYRSTQGAFTLYLPHFLTSTENNAYSAYYWFVYPANNPIYWSNQYPKTYGFSIRCRKD